MAPVRAAFLPSLLDPLQLRGCVAVVIDVLRATSTIIQALSAGAEAVIPCGEIEAARQLAGTMPAGRAVLGGERYGKLIPGFDLDNSQQAYTSETVAGRVVVFTTTNGTRAIERAAPAERLLIGALNNRRAIVEELRRDGRPAWLLCSGTDGQVTAEDVLCAGAIASELPEVEGSDVAGFARIESATEIEAAVPTDPEQAARIAAAFFRSCGQRVSDRLATLRSSRGGTNLCQLGKVSDIDFAAQLDTCSLVPEWDRATGGIRALPGM